MIKIDTYSDGDGWSTRILPASNGLTEHDDEIGVTWYYPSDGGIWQLAAGDEFPRQIAGTCDVRHTLRSLARTHGIRRISLADLPVYVDTETDEQ